jgi:nucleotide-binding universal stress UspA family protein
MKTILLLVHDDAGQEARLQAALDLGRALEGHVHCLDVAMLPVVDDGFGEALLLQEECARERANKRRLEDRLRHEDIPWSWADETGPLAACVAEAAALADVIVLNRKLDAFPYPDMRETAGSVILKTGKPVIAVPDDASGFTVAGRALVAWDGSARTAVALQAAAPLLKLAASVVLLEIADGSIEIPAEEAAAYLSKYDINARVVRDYALSNPPSDILLVGVQIQRADYVVMGAYSHARLTEAVIGGCTRAMLTRSPVPLFLAH